MMSVSLLNASAGFLTPMLSLDAATCCKHWLGDCPDLLLSSVATVHVIPTPVTYHAYAATCCAITRCAEVCLENMGTCCTQAQ